MAGAYVPKSSLRHWIDIIAVLNRFGNADLHTLSIAANKASAAESIMDLLLYLAHLCALCTVLRRHPLTFVEQCWGMIQATSAELIAGEFANFSFVA